MAVRGVCAPVFACTRARVCVCRLLEMTFALLWQRIVGVYGVIAGIAILLLGQGSGSRYVRLRLWNVDD